MEVRRREDEQARIASGAVRVAGGRRLPGESGRRRRVVLSTSWMRWGEIRVMSRGALGMRPFV